MTKSVETLLHLKPEVLLSTDFQLGKLWSNQCTYYSPQMNNGVNEDILNTYSSQSFSHWLRTKYKQRGCELSRALILSPVKSSCLFGYNARHPHKCSGANKKGHRFWIGSKLTTFSPPPSYPWGKQNNMKLLHTFQWAKAVQQPGKCICLCRHQSQGAASAASLIALHQGMFWHYANGSVLTERSNTVHASVVKPSLFSLGQHRGVRRNATDHCPYPTDRCLPSHDSTALLS